jgi:hypothetical protein
MVSSASPTKSVQGTNIARLMGSYKKIIHRNRFFHFFGKIKNYGCDDPLFGQSLKYVNK